VTKVKIYGTILVIAMVLTIAAAVASGDRVRRERDGEPRRYELTVDISPLPRTKAVTVHAEHNGVNLSPAAPLDMAFTRTGWRKIVTGTRVDDIQIHVSQVQGYADRDAGFIACKITNLDTGEVADVNLRWTEGKIICRKTARNHR